MTTTPYQFIERGNLFIKPVSSSVSEVPHPVQALTKPRDYSLWVRGQIEEPAFQLDNARMPPSLYQEVRDDLVKFSPVEVTRSAFQRSQHAYVGVIDSKGKPYYFALDSRGISVREADINDEKVWKTFDQLSDHERSMALNQRRSAAAVEMIQVDKELSEPRLFIKGGHTGTMVALHLPSDVARQVAIPGGEEPSSMHITVAYLGKDLSETQKSAALCAVRRVAQRCGPIKAQLGGVGRFSASHTSEGKDVIYLSVDSSDLTRLHPMLVEELAAEGIAPSNAHGYVPHVTLAYVSTTASTPLKRFPPISVEFPCLSLTVADNNMSIPFASPQLFIKALHPHAQWAADQLRAGKKVSHENGTRAYRNQKLNASTGKMETTHYTVISPHGMKTIHDTPEEAGAKAHTHTQTIKKALPKKAKEEKVKKTPNKKVSSKKTGAGGKTRYSYPNEKGAGAQKPKPLPLVVMQHDDSKNADPAELANQLGVSIRTLQRCAEKLGRDGFSKFMRSRLKRFSAKHRIDPDYWGTMYGKLRPGVD